MGEYHIRGCTKLTGEVKISGAKNAVLPILAATVLVEGTSIIHNCPKISDVFVGIKILNEIGCKADWQNEALIIDASGANNHVIPETLVKEMRSSIFFLGSILGKFKRAEITFPGGCVIGKRPIDYHLDALEKMGVTINEQNETISCKTDNLKGTSIRLKYPSVGATENIMLAAALANGTTTIWNAAREPEIVDLQNFLNSSGAKISGAGTNTIIIDGVNKLNSTEHTIIPDRIEAGTFLIAGAIGGGDIKIINTDPKQLTSLLHKLREAGCQIEAIKNEIALTAPKKILAPPTIYTHPHPGFPTDSQPQIMSLLTLARGTSIIIETVFEARYNHVKELNSMGANITTDGRVAVIKGVKELYGNRVAASDLRAGAALVLAGLGASGETVVTNSCHIERGYENFDYKLKQIGADIEFYAYPNDCPEEC